MPSGAMFRRGNGRKSPSQHSDRHYRRRMQDHFGSPDSPPSDLGALPLRRRTTSECDGEAGPANAASPDFSARHVPQTAADILRQAGLRLGVGIFDENELEVLAKLYDNVVPLRETLTSALLCQLFVHLKVSSDPEWHRNIFAGFDVDGTGELTFRQFVRGMASMDLRAEDTDERLRYIFRAYSAGQPLDGPSAAVLRFEQFKMMVRDIRRARNDDPSEEAAADEAADLFRRSDLDLEIGFITESVFVSASLNGSFQGTDMLFRLPIGDSPLQQGTLLNPELIAFLAEPEPSEDSADAADPDGAAVASAAEELGLPGGAPEVTVARRGIADVSLIEERIGRVPTEDTEGTVDEREPFHTDGGRSEGTRISGGIGGLAGPASSSDTSASMVFDEPGDAPDLVGHTLQRQFRHASPVPSRLPSSHAASPGSPDKDASRSFSVRISREAVFDSVSTRPHPPETTRKVSVMHLASPLEARQVSREVDSVAQRVLDTVLDRRWEPPQNELFGAPPFTLVSEAEMMGLFECAEVLLLQDPMVVQCAAPVRIFGDIHGQLPDLLHFFHTFGLPCHKAGDIHLINYVFVGDFVDRGSYSLEVITLLFCLKIRYPRRVFLIRGNHEDRELNEHFGFRSECDARLSGGEICWQRANDVFDTLPVAAVVEEKILCVHGGIGSTLESVEELAAIPRPLCFPVRAGKYQAIMQDTLWSDPTSSDRTLGIQRNQRGDDMVEFGPDRVVSFLEANGLDMIVRAHQCVQRGYEFFAGQRLVTLFSATNYCGRHDNDGAIMSVSRELEVTFHVLSHRDRRPYSLWSQPQNSTPPRRRKEPKHG